MAPRISINAGGARLYIDPSSLPWQEAYKLLVGAIVPRPIAWVSTLSPEGVRNLAPFSFFTAIAADPMTICFSPMRRGRDGEKKDTLRNIEATGEFVVNIVSHALAEQMNQTSAEVAPDVDEFLFAGLTAANSEAVKVPRVAEALFAYECKLHQVVHIGEAKAGAGSLVIGTVLRVYAADAVREGGRILTDVLQPIGRCAGNEYTTVRDRFAMDRPVVR